MKVKRFDYFKVDKARKTEAGFLTAPLTATRTGVFIYRKADGSEFRELRPADEVFKSESLETLKRIPFTNNHPTVKVDSKNARQYTVGMTGDKVEEVGGKFVKTDVTIFDDKMVSLAEAGKVEVSCGYDCDLEMTPGTFQGERYDAVQRNIVYNHLASVVKGRAGVARLHLDSGDAVIINDDNPEPEIKPNVGVKSMTKVKIDGVEYEVSETAASAIVNAQSKHDTEIGNKDGEIASLTAKTQKFDELQGKHDALESEVKTLKDNRLDDDAVNAAVKTRIGLIEVATERLDDEALKTVNDLSDRDIKVAVIKADCADFDGEGKSDDYIQARYDHVAQSVVAKSDEDLKDGIRNVDGARGNDKQSADAKREASTRNDANAWEKPLTGSKGATA